MMRGIRTLNFSLWHIYIVFLGTLIFLMLITPQVYQKIKIKIDDKENEYSFWWLFGGEISTIIGIIFLVLFLLSALNSPFAR